MTKLSLSGLFLEPGYSFDVGYRVRKLIRRKANEKVFANYNSRFKSQDASLTITTGKSVTAINIREKIISKEFNNFQYIIELPFFEINEQKEKILQYVDYVFCAISLVMVDLNIDEMDKLDEAQEEVNAEIERDPTLLINDDDDVLKMYKKIGKEPPR